MKRVLIVDDSSIVRKQVRKVFAENGYNVVGEAENGLAAVQKYGELLPDIVTLDISMPEMGGFEALAAMNRIKPATNVIMFSDAGEEMLVAKALQYGAKGFVVKPFKKEALLSALAKMEPFTV